MTTQAVLAEAGYCRMPCLGGGRSPAGMSGAKRSSYGSGRDGGSPNASGSSSSSSDSSMGGGQLGDSLVGGVALSGRWSAADPAWLGAMQLGWESSAEVKAAILREWVTFVRRRLDLGASRASACAGRLLQVRGWPAAAAARRGPCRRAPPPHLGLA